MGKGFPIGQLPADQYSTILMFATGSGIAPVKALIESPDLQVPVNRAQHYLGYGVCFAFDDHQWFVAIRLRLIFYGDVVGDVFACKACVAGMCVLFQNICSALLLHCRACMQAGQRKDVRLYYGTHSEAMTPFQQEAAEWADVQLVNVYSTAGKGYVQVETLHDQLVAQCLVETPQFRCLQVNYRCRASQCCLRSAMLDALLAQDVFARDGAITNGATTGAVLCGQKQMCEQITQILVERGVAKENILLNF